MNRCAGLVALVDHDGEATENRLIRRATGQPSIDPPAEHDDADLAAGAAPYHGGGRMIIVETFAQRRTPSPAIAQSRVQDRDAMTPITAFVALPARREPRFRCRIAAMLAGIPVKERVRICNDGTADSRRRRACQDLETGAELRRFESLTSK